MTQTNKIVALRGHGYAKTIKHNRNDEQFKWFTTIYNAYNEEKKELSQNFYCTMSTWQLKTVSSHKQAMSYASQNVKWYKSTCYHVKTYPAF